LILTGLVNDLRLITSLFLLNKIYHSYGSKVNNEVVWRSLAICRIKPESEKYQQFN